MYLKLLLRMLIIMGDKICFLRESGYSTKRLPPPSLGGVLELFFLGKKMSKCLEGGPFFWEKKMSKCLGDHFLGKKCQKKRQNVIFWRCARQGNNLTKMFGLKIFILFQYLPLHASMNLMSKTNIQYFFLLTNYLLLSDDFSTKLGCREFFKIYTPQLKRTNFVRMCDFDWIF